MNWTKIKKITRRYAPTALIIFGVVFMLAAPINLSLSGIHIQTADAAAWWDDLAKSIAESLDIVSSFKRWFYTELLQFFANAILSFAALVTYLGALILDWAMGLTVNMAGLLQQIPVVDTGWVIFRDLANVLFIFVLLYIAIATILNLANAQKMLASVIVTAILLNFSLFFTKIIVDASNMVAKYFYDQMQLVDAEPAGIQDGVLFNFKGPAAAMMNGLRLQTIYEGTRANNSPVDALVGNFAGLLADGFKTLIVTLLGAALMVIAGVIFGAAGLLLMIRIIVLFFLMMLSPLAFVARVLPSFQGQWLKWWKSLINNALFAPAYFILTYAIIQVVNSGFGSALAIDSSASFSAALQGVQSSGGLIINYVFITGLLVGSLLIAKELGISGASGVMKGTKNIRQKILGATGRNTFGRLAHNIVESDRFKSMAAKNPGLGYFAYKGLDKARTASFGDTKKGYKGKIETRTKGLTDYAEHVTGKVTEESAGNSRGSRNPQISAPAKPQPGEGEARQKPRNNGNDDDNGGGGGGGGTSTPGGKKGPTPPEGGNGGRGVPTPGDKGSAGSGSGAPGSGGGGSVGSGPAATLTPGARFAAPRINVTQSVLDAKQAVGTSERANVTLPTTPPPLPTQTTGNTADANKGYPSTGNQQTPPRLTPPILQVNTQTISSGQKTASIAQNEFVDKLAQSKLLNLNKRDVGAIRARLNLSKFDRALEEINRKISDIDSATGKNNTSIESARKDLEQIAEAETATASNT